METSIYDNKKVLEMVKMQKALDDAIYKENNTQYDKEKAYMALFDEVGELIHELKGDWCWWKKTQSPVNMKKVLEELVDVWHFALSIYYHEYEPQRNRYKNWQKEYLSELETTIFLSSIHCPIHSNLVDIVDYKKVSTILIMLYEVTIQLGFTLEDVFKAYKEKNQENYDRLARGY